MDTNDKLLTMKEVEQIVGYCKVTIYKMVREGRFPQQVQLGPNKVAWFQSEVLIWISNRADARYAA
ncbi:AlpA family transcriptional regulator [Rhizorhabdus wittichii]|uniref:AlpA family transcriptional regulator n=1 Tax=Rhizorhabdus wittichii TaxID=160791 RepID=A0A975D5C7_9SPHN|nr:AlpA family transcriptional regulator [Rhizorhabdus wittichii]QTH23420.1 AlpA family transcriptional regulator [Rhizorhabdus wittichii]